MILFGKHNFCLRIFYSNTTYVVDVVRVFLFQCGLKKQNVSRTDQWFRNKPEKINAALGNRLFVEHISFSCTVCCFYILIVKKLVIKHVGKK